MNKLSPTTLAMVLKAALLAIAMLAGGCGDQPPKLTSEEGKAFESAPPEVKLIWDKALAADKANDYVTAQTCLDSLNQMNNLSDQQKKALETETGSFAVRLWQAAEKNDPAAIKAIQEINKSKDRRNRSVTK